MEWNNSNIISLLFDEKYKVKLRYKFRNGKNSKFKYYIMSYLRKLMPDFLCRISLNRKLKLFNRLQSEEQSYILDRVNYYCNLDSQHTLDITSQSLGDLSLSKRDYPSPYYFDTYEYFRYFKKSLKWQYKFGDIRYLFNEPTITKSRPLNCNNQNSILLNLDKNRHFVTLKDQILFEEKMTKAIFRGDVVNKQNRIDFMYKFFDHPLCDIGEVGRHDSNTPLEWRRGTKALYEHLKYKFIFSLEGNDVASNLKWVMSSNSLAVMPRPTCETWFMEGRLIGGVHYVEVADDFSDLDEKLQYYTDHPEKAAEIIRNANSYVAQFQDKRREDLISLMVLQRYFEKTGQL